MSDLSSIDLQNRLLQRIASGIASRQQAEIDIETRYAEVTTAAQQQFDEIRGQLSELSRQQRAAARDQREARRQQITRELEQQIAALERESEEALRRIHSRFETEAAAAEQERDDARWLVGSVLDETAETSPQYRFNVMSEQFAQTQARMTAELDELEAERLKAIDLLDSRGHWHDPPPPIVSDHAGTRDELRQQFTEAAAEARQAFKRLHRQVLPTLFGGRRWLGWLLLLTVGLIGIGGTVIDPAMLGFNWQRFDPPWLLSLLTAALLPSLLISYGFQTLAAQAAEESYLTVAKHVERASVAHRRWMVVAQEELSRRERECDRWRTAAIAKRDEATRLAEERYAKRLAAATQEKNRALRDVAETYPPQIARLRQTLEQETAAIEAQYEQELAESRAEFDQHVQIVRQEHESRLAEAERQREQAWEELARQWKSTLDEAHQLAEEMNRSGRDLAPLWEELANPRRTLPARLPPAIRFGEFVVRLDQFEGGIPYDKRLISETEEFRIPALLPFPSAPSMLFKVRETGRSLAVEAMQTVMLRMLTTIPPGNVRFTIFDPVGLGENFAAFMHLADIDERLVTSRIWTEPTHIEQRLSDITEHMEDVLQTYLRNEFASIEEYNTHAGEVAEPYHILVVANFPANFSDAAARRLLSIATSGPRCGVYTLISVDTRQQLPHGFPLADLEQTATVLQWQEGRFQVVAPEPKPFPLRLDTPPAPELFADIVRLAGRQAKDARRVEVPFDRVAPSVSERWTHDSRSGIDVPLGRAGATKRQHLRLGRGTSQHVLIAGKTGSGKSSFLHALITNLALHYSPDEIEFYLIDFKKGVEFKTYATHALPHARVIGIESDREFGVSALQRLDGVLRERGELFRRAGVQDIEAYRNAHPDERLPRILLIVDEFQEFFVEDDQLAQNASLLLDRLVRQGRAFGIHVLLGSQTLGGAYSLARSTLGQVAVRVALQCSEADAHLILSEENTAARLLSRPGEAIYNDANGLLEGNHPFQIVWLPDEQREVLLQQLQEMTRERQLATEPPVVFEGHIPADPARNRALRRLLEARSATPAAVSGAGTSVPQAWLGEAIAIKDPTAATFPRRSGRNLLLVGQNPDAALGILANSVIALAAQCRPQEQRADAEGARFYVLDGTGREDAHGPIWSPLADALGDQVRLAETGAAAGILAEIAAEVARRDQAGDESAPPIFLILDHLARFRELRKDDDDFGFSGLDNDKPPSPSRQLGEILSSGPSVGVHVLAWCDSYNNVSRWLSRDMLREFEMRVAFQMSATDSSNLIDSPAAGRLGMNRAMFYVDDEGTLEKFRPYAPPSAEWLAQVAAGREMGEPLEVDRDDLARWTVL